MVKSLIYTLSTSALLGTSILGSTALADISKQMTFQKTSPCSPWYCPFEAELNDASSYRVISVKPDSSSVDIEKAWTDSAHVVIQPHSDGTIPSFNNIKATVTLSDSGPTPPSDKASFHLQTTLPAGLQSVQVTLQGADKKTISAIAGDNTISNVQANESYQISLPANILYRTNNSIYTANCHLSANSVIPSNDGSQAISLNCTQGEKTNSVAVTVQPSINNDITSNATVSFDSSNTNNQFSLTQLFPTNKSTTINLPSIPLTVSAKTIDINGTTYIADHYNQSITPNSGTIETIQYAKAGIPKVPGWPNTHIAMGNLTDGTSGTLKTIQAAQIPVDSVFKYAGTNGGGDRGRLIYPTVTNEIIHQAQALGDNTVPTMVVYTAQMSGGTNFCDFVNAANHPSIPCDETSSNTLDKHMVNLALLAQMLGNSNRAGSIVLNPDLFGQITQNNLSSQLDSMHISVQQAVNTAYRVATAMPNLTMQIKYSSGKIEPHTFSNTTLYQDYQWLFANVYNSSDYWDAGFGDYMTQLLDAAFTSALSKANDKPAEVPTFTNNFSGWIQANNWLIKEFGGDQISYGWLENMWAPKSGNWIHNGKMTSAQIEATYTTPVMAILNKYKVYNGTYRPSYIAFDKYEKDVIPGAVSDWLYNQNDWSNYLQAVTQVSDQTGMNNQPTPVMLFQIPGGHILSKDNDPANMAEHISTAPDFIFGDTQLGDNLAGAADVNEPALNGNYLNYALPSNYNCNGCTVKQYLTVDKQNWTEPHTSALLSAHVFSVLWGGGTGPTTSMTSYPVDDHGWMASKIAHYESSSQH